MPQLTYYTPFHHHVVDFVLISAPCLSHQHAAALAVVTHPSTHTRCPFGKVLFRAVACFFLSFPEGRPASFAMSHRVSQC